MSNCNNCEWFELSKSQQEQLKLHNSEILERDSLIITLKFISGALGFAFFLVVLILFLQ